MSAWQIWASMGAILIILEFIIPGGIVVFLGVASLFVAALVHFEVITTLTSALILWFMSSIFLMLFLRSFFMKYFEGDSYINNVDEDDQMIGSVVVISEDIFPYKEGRVRFRNSTWIARSEEELKTGDSAKIIGREGNNLIIKSILE